VEVPDKSGLLHAFFCLFGVKHNNFLSLCSTKFVEFVTAIQHHPMRPAVLAAANASFVVVVNPDYIHTLVSHFY